MTACNNTVSDCVQFNKTSKGDKFGSQFIIPLKVKAQKTDIKLKK